MHAIPRAALLVATLSLPTAPPLVQLPDDPYLLLGCESGNVRVVALLDEQDRPAEGARQAADLSLQPYQGGWGGVERYVCWSGWC